MSFKDQFLASARSKPEEVEITGADGAPMKVRLKRLTSAEVQSAFVQKQNNLTDQQRGLLIQRKAVAASVVDENGEVFLTEQDVAAGMDMSIVKDLFEHVMKLNGMSEKAAEEAQGN